MNDTGIVDSPSADYWKILAETRRQALEKALEENERLYTEVGELKMKVEELEEERSKYEELAERAEYLADTLKVSCRSLVNLSVRVVWARSTDQTILHLHRWMILLCILPHRRYLNQLSPPSAGCKSRID